MDLDRYTTSQPPDDAPAEGRVCVVATQPDTFERCREGIYPAPASYPRTDARVTYLACYRTAPVSSLTHYARVTDRRPQTRGENGPMDADDWEVLIDPFADTDRVVVFELDTLVPLADPIANDTTGVRGAWYCTIGDLRTATTLSELAARAET
jgi:hypothetical protein